MRQGHVVADILYHLGNDTPLKIATWRMRPAPPAGYDYDVCDNEVLINRASVKKGRITLPDGMSYRLLILAGGNQMTLAAAKKLRALVNAGATVLGPIKPTRSPTLTDGVAGDEEVPKIAKTLGKGPLKSSGEHRTGAGRIIWGMPPARALAALDTPPDFDVTSGNAATKAAVRAPPDSGLRYLLRGEPPDARRAAYGGVPRDRTRPRTMGRRYGNDH